MVYNSYYPSRNRNAHGGKLAIKKRKTKRPIDVSRSLHVVLKSERAKGAFSLLHVRNKKRIKRIIYHYAKYYDQRVHHYANVGNHIHLLVKTKSREDFQNFLRVAAGRVALAVLNINGRISGKFWSFLAFSRIVSWGKDFDGVMNYINFNLVQATGLIRKSDYSRTPLVIGDVEFG